MQVRATATAAACGGSCGAVPRHEHARQGGGVYIGTNADAKARAVSSQRVHRRERGREGASGQLAAT